MTTPKEQLAKYKTPDSIGTYFGDAGSTSLIPGTLAATSDAAQLSTGQGCTEVDIQNDPDNAVDILLGCSSAQPIQLGPADIFTIPVANVNLVYVRTVSSTATVVWLAHST